MGESSKSSAPKNTTHYAGRTLRVSAELDFFDGGDWWRRDDACYAGTHLDVVIRPLPKKLNLGGGDGHGEQLLLRAAAARF